MAGEHIAPNKGHQTKKKTLIIVYFQSMSIICKANGKNSSVVDAKDDLSGLDAAWLEKCKI